MCIIIPTASHVWPTKLSCWDFLTVRFLNIQSSYSMKYIQPAFSYKQHNTPPTKSFVKKCIIIKNLPVPPSVSLFLFFLSHIHSLSLSLSNTLSFIFSPTPVFILLSSHFPLSHSPLLRMRHCDSCFFLSTCVC